MASAENSWEIASSALDKGAILGKGSFGSMYRAQMGLTDVAVREINDGGVTSKSDVIDEIEIITGFSHENLAKVFGMCLREPPLRLVTEFVSQGSVFSYLENATNRAALRRGDPKAVVNMCVQVCKGMAYLEANEYVHCDLTLRNCFIGDNQVVKIADFGLANFRADIISWIERRANIDRCSIAPEVLESGMFTHRSDVWDFGVLIWEMFLYGRSRYDWEKCKQIRHQNVPGWGCTEGVVYRTVGLCCDTRDSVRPSFEELIYKVERIV